MLRNNSHNRWFWTWKVRRVFPNEHLDGMIERSTGERISFVIRKLYQRVLWYINWICALILYTLKLTKKYLLTTSKAASSPVEDYHVLKKVGSDILNEGVCRDKLFPMDHSMYGKLENPFPGLINLGIRRRLANGKNQNETEHWAAALTPAYPNAPISIPIRGTVLLRYFLQDHSTTSVNLGFAGERMKININ